MWCHNENKVMLHGPHKSNGSINASYITGYKDNAKHYIATEGLTSKLYPDFWLMVWQEKSQRIVMFGPLMEDSKDLSEKYWPVIVGQRAPYGQISVESLTSKTFSDYTVRNFKVSKDGETRDVIHLQFTAWRDDAIPDQAFPVLSFRRRLRSLDESSGGPIIVHCSSSCGGASGTFIAIDYLLDQAEYEGEVDIFKYSLLMRSQRMNMIQTLEQYRFIYLALSDAILTGVTAIPSQAFAYQLDALTTLHQYGRSQLSKQFQMLNTDLSDTRQSQSGFYQNIHSEANGYNDSRVDDFDNAVFVDTYKSKRGCIAAVMPSPSNINEFWRQVFVRSCRTIIMLNERDNSYEISVPYWPDGFDEPQTYGEIQVSLKRKEVVKGYTVRELNLINISQGTSSGDVTVKHFHLTSWPDHDNVPADTDVIINLMTAVNQWQQQVSNNTPVIVHAKEDDDLSKAGLYCSAAYVIEKLKEEQEVDVFTSVRQMRLSRPEAVVNLEQYKYLHTLTASFIKSV